MKNIGFIDIFNIEEVVDLKQRMERCVMQSDIKGFEELLPQYNFLIQDLTIKYV